MISSVMYDFLPFLQQIICELKLIHCVTENQKEAISSHALLTFIIVVRNVVKWKHYGDELLTLT